MGALTSRPNNIHFIYYLPRSQRKKEINADLVYTTGYLGVLSAGGISMRAHAYRISDETIKSFRKGPPLFESTTDILREQGFNIQLHAKLTGTSELRHPFDIVAKRKGTLLVGDVSFTGDKNDAISLLGKKMDVNPTEALLIDFSDRDELVPLGNVYDITILKGKDERQLKTGLRNFLVILDCVIFSLSFIQTETMKKQRQNER